MELISMNDTRGSSFSGHDVRVLEKGKVYLVPDNEAARLTGYKYMDGTRAANLLITNMKFYEED